MTNILGRMDLRIVAVIYTVVVFRLKVEGGGLSFDFYKQACPQVEDIVRAGLHSISLTDPTTPAAILRLMFHDCQVQGCDASILLDPEGDSDHSELTSTKNFGLRKRETVNLIKSMVEAACPQQVSCANILVLAAREAVALSGGPRILNVPLGRRDSSTPPNYKAADASLPPPNLGVDGMLQIFANKGMTVEESVAIMGAHTLGVTHCLNVQGRLYQAEGGQNNIDIEPRFQTLLKLSCPLGSLTSNISFVLNDPTTLLFDNQYYMNSMSGRGILRIDAEMSSDPRTAQFVRGFATDENQFFKMFSSAFVKLSSSNVLTDKNGEIRRSCNVLN